MTKNFKVIRETRGDVALFKLQGYLNDLGGEEVERLFQEEVRRGFKKFILDFSRVAYINSIGVSFLLGILETTRDGDLMLCFTALSKINEELFDMVGLKKYAFVFPTNEEACAYLNGR
jgi:anti-anti-sigma factor